MPQKLMIAAVVALLASPAYAFHCPADMAKIDAALPTAQLSAANKAKVTELRQQGEVFHAAGQHRQSVDVLAEAMAILGI